ncbi:hypothetical protein ACIQU4_03420 [Streptomyces sp. NPDC090741]|uniref:hypothetical protein n=1 Tax=Streptomyces sp. NPDC090741 TaxID=3365967 RepID=UPI0038302E3D
MMNRLVRIAVLAPLAASPLVLGPTVPRPTPRRRHDTLAVTSDNGSSVPAAKVTAGSVRVSALAPGHYTVGGVACTGGAEPAKDGTGTDTGADAKAQYDKGFQKGFQAIRASCTAEPPKTLGQVDPNWQKGYDSGAALAAKTFCGGKQDGQTGTSEYDKGHKLGYDTTKATCQTAPPKTAVAPDPEWTRGYNEGATKAAAEFCK